MSIKQIKDSFYIKLAYRQAEINLGSTGTNPSVGAIVVKNSSVISSGYTSLKGRPHAESNALKNKLNYKNFKEAKDFEQFVGNLNVYKSE